MSFNKNVVYFLLITIFTAPLFAENEDKMSLMELGYTSDNVAKLLNGDRLSATAGATQELYFMPKSLLINSIRQSLISKAPTTLVEAAYYIPKIKANSISSLYNSLLDVKTLEGLEFYSRSEKKVKVLVYSAFTVDAVGSKTPMAVNKISNIPAEYSFIINQDDETFGNAYYNVLINNDRKTNEIAMRITNVSSLKQKGIKMAGVGDMQTCIISIPLKNGLLVYNLATNKKSPPSFVKDKMNQSLLNRLDAYKNWIVARYKAN